MLFNFEITFTNDEIINVFEGVNWFIIEEGKITFNGDCGFHQFSMVDIDRIENT